MEAFKVYQKKMQQNYDSDQSLAKKKKIYFLIFGKLSLKSTTQAHMTAHCEDNTNKEINFTTVSLDNSV